MFKVYLKNNIISNALVIILSILTGFVALKISEQVKLIFNEAIVKNNLAIFEQNILFIVLLYIMMFFLNLSNNVLENYINWNGKKNLAMFSLDKLTKTKYTYFLKNNSASTWTDIGMSADRVASYYSAIFDILSYIIKFSIYAVIIFNVNLYAGIFSLLAIPIIFLTTIGVKKKRTYYYEKMIEESRGLSAISVETLNTIRNIKVKNEYDFFIEKIDKRYTNLNRAVVGTALCDNYWIKITDLINSIIPISVLYLIMKFTSLIKTTQGDIIVLYSFIPMLLASFKGFYSMLMNIYASKPFIKSIKKYFDLAEENTGTVLIKEFKSLETENLQLDNSGQIVKIPDIKIMKGEKTLIIGESGIGKSTLFNIMLGLRKDYTGSIKINDYELSEINIESLRKIIGISFQGHSVFSLNLKENINLGNKELLDINKIIEIVQLEKLAEDKKDTILNINSLSGGEQSRISIAQNLIRNPQVILIDESLSSVDEIMEAQIIKNIMDNFIDKTVVCISHRKSTQKYFDKVLRFGRKEEAK